KRLNPNDRDDHFSRHAIFLLGALKRSLVLAPEIDPLSHTRFSDEDRPIFLPRLDALGWPRDRIENRLLAFRLSQHVNQLLAGETVILSHCANKLGDLFALVFRSGYCRPPTKCTEHPRSAEHSYPPATP